MIQHRLPHDDDIASDYVQLKRGVYGRYRSAIRTITLNMGFGVCMMQTGSAQNCKLLPLCTDQSSLMKYMPQPNTPAWHHCCSRTVSCHGATYGVMSMADTHLLLKTLMAGNGIGQGGSHDMGSLQSQAWEMSHASLQACTLP